MNGESHVPPQRPYLLRAMHEWMTDAGHTPHIVVDTTVEGVEIPRQFIDEDKLILNISYAATGNLELGNAAVGFDARFGGTPCRVRIPLPAILGIYARETGQGLIFNTDEYQADEAAEAQEADETSASGRPHLKLIK